MIVEIFVAEGEPHEPLPDEVLRGVLAARLAPRVVEALGESLRQAQEPEEKLEPPMTKWIRCCTTRFSHCSVENLSPTKQYQFRVTAENLNGRSDPCEPTSELLTS